MINWPLKVKLRDTKHSRWYESLIKKAQTRTLPKDVYTEGHHIIPKSWGGADTRNNIVRLTAREHYVAHAILWKMNVSIGYHNKMVHAFNAMCIMKDGSYNKPGYKLNSRLFESVRLERVAHLQTLKGPLSPAWGKKQNISEEGKLNRKKSVDELWNDPVRKAKTLENRRIANQRPEVIVKRKAASDALRGIKRDPAIIEKCAAKKRGKTWEELYTPEQIQRMHEANKNKEYTPEGKQRQIETARKNGQRPKGENFKKLVGLRFKGRTDMDGEKNPNYGKKWTVEEKQAMSKRKLGSKLSPEALAQRRYKMAMKKKQSTTD
jgi:hypothetical protein